METTLNLVRRELEARLDQLTPAQQQQLLQMANELLALPTPVPNRWAHLAGMITPEDAAIMEQASLECRQIEPDTTPTW